MKTPEQPQPDPELLAQKTAARNDRIRQLQSSLGEDWYGLMRIYGANATGSAFGGQVGGLGGGSP
jgi:hypothetical protein